MRRSLKIRHHLGGARRPLRPGRLHDRSERGSAGLVGRAERRRRRRTNGSTRRCSTRRWRSAKSCPKGRRTSPTCSTSTPRWSTRRQYASTGPKKACFANASISNPWRQTGWITMNQQLEVLQEAGAISEMETRDAQDSDDTQIADIDYFINEGNCDVFIISPNSTAAMTPAVERACDTGKPVIVFDRGVETDCPGHVHPPHRRIRVGASTRPSSSSTIWRRVTRSSAFAFCRASTCSSSVGRRPRSSSTRPASTRSTTSPVPTRPRSRASSATSWPRATSRASGWMPVTAPSRRSRRSRTPAWTTPS